jgi:hypothetical protein
VNRVIHIAFMILRGSSCFYMSAKFDGFAPLRGTWVLAAGSLHLSSARD